MTSAELAETLTLLRWPYREVAAELGCDEKMIRRWLDGSADIPPLVSAWFSECRHLALQIRWPKAPDEKDWRKNSGYAPRQRRRAVRAA